MASLVWLIVWLIQGTPNLDWFGSWNDWAVALLTCIVFDLFSGREAGARRRREPKDWARMPCAPQGPTR